VLEFGAGYYKLKGGVPDLLPQSLDPLMEFDLASPGENPHQCGKTRNPVV
jgi:hypothetical protein